MDTRTKIIDRSSIPAQGARLVSGYFDPLTAAALASLERLRAETPGPLVAVITDPENPVLPARARAALGKEVVDAYHAEEAEKILAPVCKFLARHGVDAKRSVKVGLVGESIAKVADTGKFDLLVMGSHGHGALATLVMGSVTTQVLAHSKVPLLIVR